MGIQDLQADKDHIQGIIENHYPELLERYQNTMEAETREELLNNIAEYVKIIKGASYIHTGGGNKRHKRRTRKQKKSRYQRKSRRGKRRKTSKKTKHNRRRKNKSVRRR